MQRPEARAERCLVLDGHELSIEDVVTIARHPGADVVALAPDAAKRMGESAALKEALIDAGVPVYGVTSGFGDSSARQVSRRKAASLQANLIRFLAAGVGPFAEPDVVRATMAIRANCLARGASGVRPELITALIDMLNADVLPRIPERGSVGASGDLVPLSYLAAAVTGMGEVSHLGRVRPSAETLADCGLTPVTLEAKEGLALVNGTSFMTAFAVLALHDARELAFVTDLCTALTSQVRLGNPAHFTRFLFDMKPHQGTAESAVTIRGLLARDTAVNVGVRRPDADFAELPRQISGSLLCEVRPARHRSTARHGRLDTPVDGPTARAHRRRKVQQRPDSQPHPGGGGRRLRRRTLPRFQGHADSRVVADRRGVEVDHAASSLSRSTEAHNQDKVSMGTIAARDARSVVELVQRVAAIHIIALCQAADLRGLDHPSPSTRAAYDEVRGVCAFLDQDRPLDREIELVAAKIRSGALLAAVGRMPAPETTVDEMSR